MQTSKKAILTINLLPPNEKEELVLESKKKLIIVLGTIIIVALLYLVLVLLLLKFYILQEVVVQKNLRDEVERRYRSAEEVALQKQIQDYNKALEKMNVFYTKDTGMSSALKNVMGIMRPPGISFESLAVKNGPGETVEVSIGGVSSSREDLLQFKSNLEDDRLVKNASFSPSSWIKPKNSNFSLFFEISK